MGMSPMTMRAAVDNPQEAIARRFKPSRIGWLKVPNRSPLTTFRITDPPRPAREMSQSEEPLLPCRIR